MTRSATRTSLVKICSRGYAWHGGANIARTPTSQMAGGETEQEAIKNLAIKLHLRLWGEENL